MAHLEEKNRCKSKNGRLVKERLKVDLTPMVDLGFLLITFFILSAALSQPTIARLVLPRDTNIKTLIKESNVLTVMLTRNDSIAWFEGTNLAPSEIQRGSFLKLRSLIQKKRQKITKLSGDRTAMVVIISPGKQATYKNFVDALDEIQINPDLSILVRYIQN